MFDLKEELKNYQPLLEIEEIETSLQQSQMQDLLDIVQHIVEEQKNNTPRKTR